jgi:hypothetical protein
VEEFVDSAIEARQDEIAAGHGFKIKEHSLVLYGRCLRPACEHRKSAAAGFPSGSPAAEGKAGGTPEG